MTKRYSFVLAGLALTLAFVTPAQAQDVAKEGEAASAEMMKSPNEWIGEAEGCQCPCMQAMHEKMMEMHGEAEGHAEGMDAAEGHAEGMDAAEGNAEMMDSDEGHAEMMAAHKEMMAGCKCMSGEGDEAMSCKMHGEKGEMGEMKGEGMQHQHGMESDSDSEAETEAEG
jgi:hypothetical protein